MKNNNKGFIAISLIYSFFLIFLMTLLMVALSYTKNRVLLNNVKNSIQEYLNNLSEFNPVTLENRSYLSGEEVKFGLEMWQVVEDKGNNVTLILKRNLTNEEITSALNVFSVESAIQNDKVSMCLNEHSTTFCNYYLGASLEYNYYNWNISLVKRVVEDWITNDATLQKAIATGKMLEMDFVDLTTKLSGEENRYQSYIRIPLIDEAEKIKDENIWYLSSSNHNTDGTSLISIYNAGGGVTTIPAHNSFKAIRPVINVQKAI